MNPAARPEDVQATFCATLADEWVRCGIRHAVVSPGSRSTPMALALAAESRLVLHVILDERSASFFALGLAKATGVPVVLLCTSGTAAVEYSAAVAEADLDHVSLVVCTADRPSELHGIGAPQTVDQQFLFGRSVRWFCDAGVPVAATASVWRSLACRVVLAATSGAKGPGPVQLNLPFREPLVGVASALPAARSNGSPWHASLGSATISQAQLSFLCERMVSRRGVIVAGAGSGDPSAIHALANVLGWPVLADIRSGARWPQPTTIGAADAILRSSVASVALRPEIVLRLGAPWASKVLNQWLAGIDDDVLVDPHHAWLDPNRNAAVHVATDPTSLCTEVERMLRAQSVSVDRTWLMRWQAAESAAQQVLVNELEVEVPRSDVREPMIARMLHRSLPDGATLIVSSSMPVRDVEWFAAPRKGVRVLANRGANGIDGVISTVFGVACGQPGPTVALIGDLAFLHDVGALVSARTVAGSVTFVVVDNAGGGIFEFLPQATVVPRERFELLYGTPQSVSIPAIAQAHNLHVHEVETVEALVARVAESGRIPGVSVVVIRTNRQANVAHHDELQQLVIAAIERALNNS